MLIDPSRPALDEPRRQHLHVARQHDQLDAVLGEHGLDRAPPAPALSPRRPAGGGTATPNRSAASAWSGWLLITTGDLDVAARPLATAPAGRTGSAAASTRAAPPAVARRRSAGPTSHRVPLGDRRERRADRRRGRGRTRRARPRRAGSTRRPISSVCCSASTMLPPCSATNVATAATIPGRSGHDTSSTAHDTCGAYQTGTVGTVCDDGPMMRTAWGAALAGVGLLTSLAVATAPTSEPPATVPAGSTATAAPFTTPAERLAALDAAGIDLDIGAAYPGQPADVPWPTQDWPTGDPVGADQDAINLALLTAFDNPSGEGGIDAVLVVQDGKLVRRALQGGLRPRRRPRLVVDGEVDHRHDDRHARRRRRARPDGAGRRAGVGRSERSPPRDHHRRPAAHALGPAVERGVLGDERRDRDALRRRHGRSRPLRREQAAAGRAGVDVVLLDRHVDDPVAHHRRPRRLRRRGHDLGPGQPVRTARDHHRRARPRRQRRDERRVEHQHERPRLRPLRSAQPARRELGRHADRAQ